MQSVGRPLAATAHGMAPACCNNRRKHTHGTDRTSRIDGVSEWVSGLLVAVLC